MKRLKRIVLTICLIGLWVAILPFSPRKMEAAQADNPKNSPATTFTVDNTSDNDALTACTAAANDCTLRGALTNANANPDNDTINFDAAVFSVPQTINLLTALPNIASSVAVNGPGANLLAVRRSDTAGQFRVFTIGAGLNVALSGLTVTRGRAPDGSSGGGISSGSNLILTGVAVVDNQASNGGGIALGNAGGIFTNCTVSNNTATSLFGGGIFYSGGSGLLQIANSTISGNRLTSAAGLGAGISNFGSSQATRLDVINSTIVNNLLILRPTNGAGGIFNGTIADELFAVTTLRNSIIAHNSLPNLRNSPRTTQT